MGSHWTPTTVDENVPFDEATSALIKSIRRGLEYEACYWAYLLYVSGYAAYVFRKLSLAASEDIGGGDDFSAILVSSLRSSWEVAHKQLKDNTLDKFLFIVQAVLHLCRAKKSRECDSLANLLEEHWKQGKRLTVPTYAIDPHCQRGKELHGRFGSMDGEQERISHWFNTWSLVTNKANYPDKWQKELEQIWRENDKKRNNNTQSVAKG